MKRVCREVSLNTLADKRWIIIQRTEALQDFFNHAAVEQEVAFVGNDDGLRAGCRRVR